MHGMILILALFVVLSSSCTHKESVNTFVYCSEGSPSIFNPQLASDGPSMNASARMVFNRLVEFAPGTTEIVPSLAKSWTVSGDGLKYRFQLREGVQFHEQRGFKPSRSLSSQDIAFSFERMLRLKHPYHKINGGSYKFFLSMDLQNLIEQVAVIDDLTVEFVLRRPDAPFLSNLTMDFASIHSAEYAEALTQQKRMEDIDFIPVGTGPYVFKSYTKDSLIRYTAFKDYFDGKRSIENFVFSITTEPNMRTQKLIAGECDLIAEPSPADLETLKKHPDIELISRAGLNVGYISINVTRPYLKIKKVRQAIAHALNVDSYIKAIYLDLADKAISPIPPIMWSYTEKLQKYDYSVEKAKKLMAEAGYKDGFELQLWTLPVQRPYNPNGKKMGELMQADLAKIGIRLKLQTYDWPTYLAKAKDGDHDLIQIGWSADNGDPDNFLHILLSCAAVEGGSNFSRWCHPQYNSLVEKARVTTDHAKRLLLYQEAQQIFATEVPWIPIAHAQVFRAFRKNIKGYILPALGTEYFDLLKKEK